MSGAASAIGIDLAGTAAVDAGLTAADTGFLAAADAASGIETASTFSTIGGALYGAAQTVGTFLPAIAAVGSIGSTALNAIGNIAQSRAQAASAGYNAQVSSNNAQIATTNSQFIAAQGEQNVGAAGAQTKAAVAATLANEAGSGIDVNSGSPVNVRESEAKLGMLNALNVRSQAAQQAYGYQTQAVSDTSQASLNKAQQGYDTQSGYLNAGATILGGLGKAAQYTNWLSNSGLA